MMQVKFNVPTLLGTEKDAVLEALSSRKLSGDGPFNKACVSLLKERLKAPFINLVPSCTAGLEMAYLLIDLKPGDEVILPSFTFTSTATAIALLGGKPVFVDVDETLNLDIDKTISAITPRTRAICIVHYAGASCDVDRLKQELKKLKQKIYIVEDAAQALGAKYKDQQLGSVGDIATFSFHETKNICCGEGGAIVVNNPDLVPRAEIIRDKGTNRQRFLKGEVDKYTWQDIGSSYLLGELPAAYLLEQLKKVESINSRRMQVWNQYAKGFQDLETNQRVQLPVVKSFSSLNGHIFYMILKSSKAVDQLSAFCKAEGVDCVRHYVPLHSSTAGLRFGKAHGTMERTDHLAERLIRLPLFYNIEDNQVAHVIRVVRQFFEKGLDHEG